MEVIAQGIWKATFGQPEKLTPVNLIKPDIAFNHLQSLPDCKDHPFGDADIGFSIKKRGCIMELPLDIHEKVYGFGLQLKSFNQTGKKKQLRTNSDPVADTGDSHAPVPFYVSTKGYGILVDTARYVTFYCGSSVKRRENADYEARKSVIADNTEDLYKSREFGESRSMVIDVPNVEGVDIYIFAGPDMKTVVQRYNLFAGGGCIPALSGLGVWYRAYGRANAEEALKIAGDLRKEHIPCDVFGLEPGWQSHAYSCSYVWDEERFPKPEDTIAKLKEMNFDINLWEHIFVHPSSPIHKELKQFAGDYDVWEGLVPDLSIKEAVQIFAGYHKSQLVDKGIGGFKLDECDNSDYTPAWSFPNCSEFPSGLDGEQMHSLIGLFYQKAIWEIYRDKNLRTYSQVRSSQALAAPLPFVLYSDLYDHKDFIRGVVNSGFSGLLWSPEVRHAKSAEDLIRRIQTVIFSPQALINAWYITNPPWKQFDREKNNANELLENYVEVQDICRKLFELRMQFIPYIYSSFAKYYFEGIPPFRALVMDYPKDENTYDIDDLFLMGDSILVAPITNEETTKRVYLPAGVWYCFWTDQKFIGGREYSFEVPMDRILLFMKEHSMVPLAKPLEFISKDVCFEIFVKGYGEKCNDFVLFEDDGFTLGYEKGNYNFVVLQKNENSIKVVKEGNYKGTKYKVVGCEFIT